MIVVKDENRLALPQGKGVNAAYVVPQRYLRCKTWCTPIMNAMRQTAQRAGHQYGFRGRGAMLRGLSKAIA